MVIYHCEQGAWTALPGAYTRGMEGGLNYVEVAGVTRFSPFALGGLAPTASDLNSFDAVAVSGTRVRLRWETASKVKVLGFHVYRAMVGAQGDETRINAELIPAENPGSLASAKYKYVDESASPNVTYEYRIELVRAAASIGSSKGVTITTPNECPGTPATPQLLEPTDGKTLYTRAARLKWNAAACASSYEIVLSKNAADRKVVLHKRGVNKLQVKAKELKKGNYVWRVRGCNSTGCGEWSQSGRFAVGQAP